MTGTAMIRPFLPILLTLLCTACAGRGAEADTSSPLPAAESRVTGSISTVRLAVLPQAAILRITLADVSRAGAPARVIATQTIAAGGRQGPFDYSIAYDPALVDGRGLWVVQARIEDSGRLLFISDRHHPVVTRGAPLQADLVLREIVREQPD